MVDLNPVEHKVVQILEQNILHVSANVDPSNDREETMFKSNFVEIVCPNFKTSCSCQLLLAEQRKKKTLKGDLLRAVSQLQVEGNGIKQFNFVPHSPASPPSPPPPSPLPSYPLPAITASTCNPPQSATKPRKLAIKCCTKCTPTKTRPCIRANFCKTHGY